MKYLAFRGYMIKRAHRGYRIVSSWSNMTVARCPTLAASRDAINALWETM